MEETSSSMVHPSSCPIRSASDVTGMVIQANVASRNGRIYPLVWIVSNEMDRLFVTEL